MTKLEWSELSDDERLIQLRTYLQHLIILEKEQTACCKNKEIFKKTHQKIQLEKLITDCIQWDNEL